jgi:hypothetical protein
MPDARCQMADGRCKMVDGRCQMSDVRCRMPDIGLLTRHIIVTDEKVPRIPHLPSCSRHLSSVILHLSSVICHLSSCIRHPSSCIRHLASTLRRPAGIILCSHCSPTVHSNARVERVSPPRLERFSQVFRFGDFAFEPQARGPRPHRPSGRRCASEAPRKASHRRPRARAGGLTAAAVCLSPLNVDRRPIGDRCAAPSGGASFRKLRRRRRILTRSQDSIKIRIVSKAHKSRIAGPILLP